MRSEKVIAAIVLMIPLVLGVTSSYAKEKATLTGIFSSLTYNKEGGDLLGEEIFIMYGGDGYFVVYQFSEGEPSIPVIAPLKIDGLRISFSLPGALAELGEFHGTVTPLELAGSFAKSGREIHLPRKDSYWQ